MGTNSIRGLRRSTRVVKKPPLLLPLRQQPKNRNPRRSPRLLKDSKQCVKIGTISNVDELLKTGLLNGLLVTCFSETRKGDIPGIIKGDGFLCRCSSQCNCKDQILSAKMFEKHAGAKTKFQADHVFFCNGLNLYEISQSVANIPEEDVYVKILKLRDDLKQKPSSEEPLLSPTKIITAKRSGRKRRKAGFLTSNVLEENNSFKRLRTLLRLEDADMIKELNLEEISCAKDLLKTGFLEGASITNGELEKVKSSEGSSHILKCYRRYHPKRRLMDVQGLLSTGLLEGFRVTYMRKEAIFMAYIHGAGYLCACPSCGNTKVITAREFVRHARGFSDSPYESIYLDNGMPLSQLVKELKGTPLHILGDYILEKIKCDPNNDSHIWKGSLKINNDSPSFRSDSERQPDSISRDEVSLLEASRNTDRATDAFRVGDDYSVKNLESNSDQCLSQHAKSNNSNLQHCPVSEPIIVNNLAETFTDGVLKGLNDLAEESFRKNIFESKSRVEASILEATKNGNWMGNASCVRDNDGLENLGTNPDQFLNQPNESTNSNSQQYSVFKPNSFTDPARTVIDSQIEYSNDLSKVSVPMSSFEPNNAELDTPPGSSRHPHGPSISDGLSVSCKGNLNICADKLHLSPAERKIRTPKIRTPRINKFRKHDDKFHASPSSLAEKTVPRLKFTFYGMESITASDVTEAATANSDCNRLESESKERVRDEEKTSLIGVTVKKRDGNLHKRIFEEGGLPDGTVLAYRHHNEVILTGVKQGNIIKCDCHNLKFAPSQFEAHAGHGQRRQPYRNIYNSDGKSLHELSLELPDIPRSDSGMLNSKHIVHLPRKRHERTTSILVKKDHFAPTSRRLKRIFQSQQGVLVRCTICKEKRATLGDEADPNLVVFCNQCDQAYHIGCLEDQKSFQIEDVFDGNWFCCTDCTWVHNSLKKICALGAKAVPTPFFDLLKKPHTSESNLVNLSWQIFRGGKTEDRELLSQSLQVLKSVFKPILLGRKEMMRQMVFGKQVAGTGFDFRGVFFIMIKLNEEIVSVAALRVLGKSAAELPLATTSKLWQRQGYFRMLLSLVEELLSLLHVRLLVSPVHDKIQSVWINKFGFAKASDQKVQMLKEQHSVMLFEDTSLLEKEIRAVAD